MPRLRRHGGTAATSRPSIKMRPRAGCASPATMRRIVDLPDPLGPRKVKNSPRSTDSESSSAACVEPNRFETSSIVRISWVTAAEGSSSAANFGDGRFKRQLDGSRTGGQVHRSKVGALMHLLPCFHRQIGQQPRNLLRKVWDVNEPAGRAVRPRIGCTQKTVEAGVTEEGSGTIRNARRYSGIQ